IDYRFPALSTIARERRRRRLRSAPFCISARSENRETDGNRVGNFNTRSRMGSFTTPSSLQRGYNPAWLVCVGRGAARPRLPAARDPLHPPRLQPSEHQPMRPNAKEKPADLTVSRPQLLVKGGDED